MKRHDEAVSHLQRSDPIMRSIIERVGPCMLGSATDRGGPARDHYGALVRAIVGQQLSTSAARSIFARLTDRYGGRTPEPKEVLSDDPEAMRAAMLEYRLRKLPLPERLVKLARPWRPWRSVASWYLWASLRAVPVT